MKQSVLKQLKKRVLPEPVKSTFISLLFIVSVSFSLFGFNAQAAEGNVNQKAMKIAESQTQGKAVSSKFVQQGNQKGYKVRILKDGEISHIFISIDQVQ